MPCRPSHQIAPQPLPALVQRRHRRAGLLRRVFERRRPRCGVVPAEQPHHGLQAVRQASHGLHVIAEQQSVALREVGQELLLRAGLELVEQAALAAEVAFDGKRLSLGVCPGRGGLRRRDPP